VSGHASIGETGALGTDARRSEGHDLGEELATARRLVDSFLPWLGRFGELSFDPYDFWSWPPGREAKRFYYRHPLLGSLAVLPFVAFDTLWPASRRFVAEPRRYPIADAHYAAGFFHWAVAAGDHRAAERGQEFLAELLRTRSPGFEESSWGYPFDWQSRVGLIEAETPLMTTVPYVYEAFELGYEATGRAEYLHVMESIANFASQHIPLTELDADRAAAGYAPGLQTTVVNASCYRGFLLATAAGRFRRSVWMDQAKRNVAFALDVQRPDGSWPYATMRGDEFVDNFHTCLVIKNLVKYWEVAGGSEVIDAVRRGYAFYRSHLLDNDLQPIPFAVKPRLTLHRRDLYDYAEGINLAVLLRGIDPSADVVLSRLLHGLASEWALDDGHFVTRRLVVGRNVVPYHRWAQSQTFHALARLCRKLG